MLKSTVVSIGSENREKRSRPGRLEKTWQASVNFILQANVTSFETVNPLKPGNT